MSNYEILTKCKNCISLFNFVIQESILKGVSVEEILNKVYK